MTEYEDEWAADKEATDAQTAADAGVAAGKKLDADPDFNFDEPPSAKAAADAGVAAGQAADAAPEPAKALSFKETFAARRKAGDTTFEWNGKKYTTDLKKPAAPSGVNPRSAGSQKTFPMAKAPAAEPSMSLTQKMGSDYAAVKSAADNMPTGTSPTARQALNTQVSASQKAYEQAAGAEKDGTSVAKRPTAPVKAPMALTSPADSDPLLNVTGKTSLAQGRDPRKGA